MNKKRKAILRWRVISIFSLALLAYLTGSWEEWSLNPGTWRVEYREGFSISFAVLSIIMLLGSVIAASGDSETNIHE